MLDKAFDQPTKKDENVSVSLQVASTLEMDTSPS